MFPVHSPISLLISVIVWNMKWSSEKEKLAVEEHTEFQQRLAGKFSFSFSVATLVAPCGAVSLEDVLFSLPKIPAWVKEIKL